MLACVAVLGKVLLVPLRAARIRKNSAVNCS